MPYNSIAPTQVNLSASIPNLGRVEVQDYGAPERARADQQARQDQQRDSQKKDQVIEMMIKDPKNASYYSKAFGVEITPELGGLLREPEKAQKLLEAAKLADSMGLKNYEAKRLFTQKFLETGNIAEAGAAIQGMDTREPLSRYQEAMIGVNNDRNAIARDRMDRSDFNAGMRGGDAAGPKPRAPKTVPLGFQKMATDQFDLLRGVKWSDPKNHSQGFAEGSAAPLDEQTMNALVTRAAAEYQQTGDPYSAVQRAYEEIGGEQGLAPGAESDFENDGESYRQGQGFWGSLKGLMTPDPNIKYQTLKKPSSGTNTPAPGGAPMLDLPNGRSVQAPQPGPVEVNGPSAKVMYQGKKMVIPERRLKEALAAGAERID